MKHAGSFAMKMPEARAAIERGFLFWLDLVADFTATLVNRFDSPRAVKLIEVEPDQFSLHTPDEHAASSSAGPVIRIVDGQITNVIPEPVATTLRGSRIKIILKSDRFLFSPLELPGRAAEFLDGVVRSQVDRLTPWTVAEAAFGWSKPEQIGTDRITVTVAATERALVAPYIQAVAGLGAHSITVFTAADGQASDVPIRVMEEKTAGFLDVGKIRQMLVMGLVGAGALAAVALCGSFVAQFILDAQQTALDFRLAKFRAAAGASNTSASASLAGAQLNLEKRKHSVPPSVIIIETLSRILPDDTYVTELQIEDNKVRLEGATHDAPSLIGLIEQSGLFTRASFFAPTTRSPAEAVERFHIEAVIQPRVAARS